jgi:tetratricopeptide (TPR) repeat protein
MHCCFAVILPLLGCSLAAAQAPQSFDEAMRQAAPLHNARKFAEAQAPLEAALKFAMNDEQKKRVYSALVPAYRMLPEIDKFLEAQEFLIRHADRRAGRSIAARDIASFLHQRGKIDAGIERYEARLKADAKDPAALSVLETIYMRVKRDENRWAALTAQLETLNSEIAAGVATRLEKDAEAAPQTAATLLKDAAALWLEAGDKAKALAAAKKSLAQPPEARGELLIYYWREGLGDVFLAAGEPTAAAEQYQAAIAAAANLGPQRQATEKKLADAKAAAEKQPQ